MISFLAEATIHDSIISISGLITLLLGSGAGIGGTKIVDAVRKKLISKTSNGVKEFSSHMEKNKVIQQSLRDVRMEFAADRALIFLYHNGEKTLGGLHVLKLSAMFESLEAGVTSVIKHYQSIPFSIFNRWDVGTYCSPYVIQINEDGKPENPDADPILLQKMKMGGVDTSYAVPLFDSTGKIGEGSNPIGVLNLQYLRKTELSPEELGKLCSINIDISRVLMLKEHVPA